METNLTDETDLQAGQPGNGGGRGIERLTVNLTPRSSAALDLAVELTGDTKTDAINRALQVYAYLEKVVESGGSVRVTHGGAEPRLLRSLVRRRSRRPTPPARIATGCQPGLQHT
jgi:hypothetical protein